MVKFSNDIDLLKWEPVLFRDLALASQTLCHGSDGSLNGTTFTSSSGSFINSGIAAGHVIYLLASGSSIDGCYEVVSVDSATQLTISVVRQTTDDDAIAPAGGSEIDYRISTFDPQAEEASYSLLQYFGVATTDADGNYENNVLNQRSLRQATVFGVLSAIFAGSASRSSDGDGFWKKSVRYQKMFNTARVKARLEIDTNGDNIAEQFHTGGTVRLRRL